MPLKPIISVAPMVDVTSRHFRTIIRLLTKHTELYTPMFAARRLATRKRHVVDNMLRFGRSELPLAAQVCVTSVLVCKTVTHKM